MVAVTPDNRRDRLGAMTSMLCMAVLWQFQAAVGNRPCHSANQTVSGSILRGENPVIDNYPSIDNDTR